MADNVPITAGSGTTIATDDISSVHYQRVKLVDGTLDSTAAIPGDATNGLDVDVTRLPALELLGQCPGRQDSGGPAPLRRLVDALSDGRGVDDRLGIRRAAQAGDAPGRGGRGLTGDGALVLLAGFPQPGAEVDKARADHLAGGVQDPVWRKFLPVRAQLQSFPAARR
mgnify:CR=1 FL=1